MGDQAVLAGFSQVMGQQQNAVGTQALGLLCASYCKTRRATHTGNDGYFAAAGFYRCFDDQRVLVTCEREKLARAASCKQRGGAIGSQPLKPLNIRFRPKVTLLVKISNGKRQQARADDGF